MDTTALVNALRQDLARAAEVGGEEVKAAAERLLLALGDRAAAHRGPASRVLGTRVLGTRYLTAVPQRLSLVNAGPAPACRWH
jgi:hypothetical protein